MKLNHGMALLTLSVVVSLLSTNLYAGCLNLNGTAWTGTLNMGPLGSNVQIKIDRIEVDQQRYKKNSYIHHHLKITGSIQGFADETKPFDITEGTCSEKGDKITGVNLVFDKNHWLGFWEFKDPKNPTAMNLHNTSGWYKNKEVKVTGELVKTKT